MKPNFFSTLLVPEKINLSFGSQLEINQQDIDILLEIVKICSTNTIERLGDEAVKLMEKYFIEEIQILDCTLVLRKCKCYLFYNSVLVWTELLNLNLQSVVVFRYQIMKYCSMIQKKFRYPSSIISEHDIRGPEIIDVML